MDKNINIVIKESELLILLKEKLLVTNRDKVASLIIGHLNTPFALAQLYKAIHGIFPELKYKMGDFVYVKIDQLPHWRYNKNETILLPGVLDLKYVPCKITLTNIYDESSYTISYSCLKINEITPIEDTYSISESDIHSKIENLEDIIEQIEEYTQNNT